MIVISILQMRKPRLRKLEDSGHYNDHDYTATVCVWLMKRPWFWERLRGGEGDNRGWDGWMASPTQWTRVWVNTGSWWWTGRPGVLQSVGSQRVAHDWATGTELNWMSGSRSIRFTLKRFLNSRLFWNSFSLHSSKECQVPLLVWMVCFLRPS